MNNPIIINLGECPYCDGHVTYQLTHYDYGDEWDVESKLYCDKKKCVLNHFDLFYSEWGDLSCPSKSLYPEYLEKKIRKEWHEWKADLILQQDLFIALCRKLLKEKPMT